MKVSKYEKYVSGLEGSICQVRKAVNSGALLTDMELVDYYFKRILNGENVNYSKLIREKNYRIANYYAWSLDNIEHFRLEGYSNEDVKVFCKRLCRGAYMSGLTSSIYTVKTFDTNGILYLNLFKGSNMIQEFAISGMSDFTKVALAITSFFASNNLKDGEFKIFIEQYLVSVFNEIRDIKKPTPYIYNGAAKTLKSYVVKSNVSVSKDETGKILQFRVG